jgi:hypothetical protein
MSAIQEAVCIQLAKFNDIENSVSNARWSNHNKEPVTINQGDNISITKAFVDTRNLSSSGITILDDLPVELEMYFYIINNGNPGSQAQGFNSNEPGKVNWLGPNTCKLDIANKVCYDPPAFTRQYTLQTSPNIIFQNNTATLNTFPAAQTTNSVQANVYADGRPYLLCYSDNSRYTQTFKYTIPKGTYSPDEIGTLLTTAMAEVKKTTAFALNNNEASQWWKINPTTQFLDQPFVVNTRGYPPLQCNSLYIEGSGFTQLNAQNVLSVVPNNGIQSPSAKSLCFKPIITDCPIPASSLGPIPNGPTINAAQAHIGLTYQIVTLGDTNWYAMGFDPAVVPPVVGGGFLCTAREVIPPPPSTTPFPYTEMQIGKNYIIAFPGSEIDYFSGNPVTGEYQYDTPWTEMGQSNDPPTFINDVTQIKNLIISSSNGSNCEANFQLDAQYVITEVNPPYIDLGLIGGPPNIYGPTISIDSGLTEQYYYMTSYGAQLANPFTQPYDSYVGGLTFPIEDTTFGQTRIFAENTGPIVNIQIPFTLNPLYLQVGVTYSITTYDLDLPQIWIEFGCPTPNDPSIPWVCLVAGTPTSDVGTGYAGFVVPTGGLQTITQPTFPTAPFVCTYLLSEAITPIGIEGYFFGTGTVLNTPFVDGTIAEILNPNSPNYYMYPLKLNGNPGNSSYDSVSNGIYTTLLYDYGFPLVGATEIELAYNDQLGKFQWSYIHSPIQQGVAPSTGNQTTFQEVVGIVNSFQLSADKTSFTSSTCKLTAQSGIMFKRMEPASFWMDVLGFSPNLMVTDAELGLSTDGTLIPIIPGQTDKRFTYSRFDSITSRGLLTTAMNFNGDSTYQNAETSYIPGMFYGTPPLTGQPTPPVGLMYSPVVDKWAGYEVAYATFSGYEPSVNILTSQGLPVQVPDYDAPYQWNQVWFSALDVTHPVIAERTPLLISDTFGHFLVEIQGYDSTLLNEKQKYGVKGIVSSYYNNIGSFTTLPFNDSAFLYQHVGEPITLNNFRVRILDGNLNEVEGLGRNSSIYIQINKNITAVEVAQVE